jgi:hypothetical protein
VSVSRAEEGGQGKKDALPHPPRTHAALVAVLPTTSRGFSSFGELAVESEEDELAEGSEEEGDGIGVRSATREGG